MHVYIPYGIFDKQLNQLKVEAIIDSEGYAIRKLDVEGFPYEETM